MKLFHDFHATGFDMPAIRRVPADRMLRWLGAGWHDLTANPLPSLAYGLLFGLGGDLIMLALVDSPHLAAVALSGFFLVAPLLAAGLYELSRAQGRGERLMFIDSLRVFRRNVRSLALFGLLLALTTLLWERVTAVAFGILGDSVINESFPHALMVNGEHLPFVATWFALGAMLALFVFALAVVSVPMMVDRGCDVAAATMTSLRAFAGNPVPLLLWAASIVLLTLIGFATLLLGLIVIMPLIGHASWHAYRDLVE